MRIDELVSGLEGVRKSGEDGWVACCPAHDDKPPSLSINQKDEKILLYCHAGCTQNEIIDELKSLGLWEGGYQSPEIPVQPCNLANYAHSKRLPVEFLKTLGLEDLTYRGKPAVKIPYYDVKGTETAANFRLCMTKDESNLRFNWKKNTKKSLVAVESLLADDKPVTIAKVRTILKLDKGSASRRVKAALERGLLKNNANKGKPYDLELGDPLPEDIQILPDPERLQSCMVDQEECTPPPPRERLFIRPALLSCCGRCRSEYHRHGASGFYRQS